MLNLACSSFKNPISLAASLIGRGGNIQSCELSEIGNKLLTAYPLRDVTAIQEEIPAGPNTLADPLQLICVTADIRA
jgi:hypothetical protein